MTQTAIHSLSNQPSASQPRILVMDDDANLRYIYRQALQQAGYEVHLAASIQETQALLQQQSYDVFLGDPHLDGQPRAAELLRRQIERMIEQGTQIMMLSSHMHYRAICEEMGADVFVEKPVGINRLVTLVDRLLADRSSDPSPTKPDPDEKELPNPST